MKNITKYSILFLLAFFASTTIFAQSLYLNTGTGYGFNMNGSDLSTVSTIYYYEADTNYSVSSYNNNKVSLGSGFMPTIGIGYHINDNWAVELNSMYLMGKPQKVSFNTSLKAVGFTTTYDQVSQYSGKSLMFNPSVIYNFNRENYLGFYVKFGVLFGTTTIYNNIDVVVSDAFSGSYSPFYHIIENWEYTGGISYGAQFGFGIDYSFLDNVNLYAELNYTGYSTKPKNGILTKYEYKDEDKFSELTTKEKEIEFVDEYSESELSSSKPNKLLAKTYSFNMIQLNIGIKWRLTHKDN